MVDGVDVRTNNVLRVGTRIHGCGTITKKYEKLRPTKSMCSGCRDNFYNGHNDLGVEECWCFDTAKVVNKVGYSSIHCENGPDTIMRKTLSCWHATVK
jgi:hypothetical protein